MSVVFDGSNTKYATLPNFSYLHRTKDCSLVVWFKPSGGVTQQFLGGMDQNAGGATRYTGFTYRGNSSGQVSLVRSSTETHHDLGTPVLNSWNVAVFARPNSGVAVATPCALNAADSSPSTLINQDFDLVRFIIGARRIAGGSTYTDLVNGKIGGFALYNTVLTTQQINDFQAGAHPSTVATGLVDYLIINGTGAATTMLTNAGTTMTFVGSPTLDTDTPFPSYTITSVNSGNPVKIGGTVSITVNGFTKAITKGTIDGVNLTAASSSSITIPSFVDGALLPRKGLARTLFLSSADDTETATIDIEITNPDTWSSTVIEVGFTTGDLDSIDYNFSPALAVDDIMFYDATKGTVFPDAGYEGTYAGTQTMWHHDVSTKTVYSFNLLTGSSGNGVGGLLGLGFGIGFGI